MSIVISMIVKLILVNNHMFSHYSSRVNHNNFLVPSFDFNFFNAAGFLPSAQTKYDNQDNRQANHTSDNCSYKSSWWLMSHNSSIYSWRWNYNKTRSSYCGRISCSCWHVHRCVSRRNIPRCADDCSFWLRLVLWSKSSSSKYFLNNAHSLKYVLNLLEIKSI